MFIFDETLGTLQTRCEAVGLPFREQVEAGRLLVQQVDPAELSPGEFIHVIRGVVEPASGAPASVVVIDSLNGYLNAMPGEHFLTIQLHELLTYLARRGVATLMLVAQHGIVGNAMITPVDTSYLADSVVLLRFFEATGRVRRAISVIKKRSGPHEDTIRELTIGAGGIRLGHPLTEFQGVLTGIPSFVGTPADLA